MSSAPVNAPPPSYAVISRVYRRSLRPIVLVSTLMGIIYSALWGGSSFTSIGDDDLITRKIGTFDIIIGALYMGVLAVEIFGFYAAYKESTPFIRLYSFTSMVAVVTVMAAEMLRIVIHFKFKSNIINYCIDSVMSTDPDCRGSFCGQQGLDQPDATSFCNSNWNRYTWSDIIWFIFASVMSFLFSSFAWAYLHQLNSVGTRIGAGPGVPADPDHIRLQTYNAYNPDPHSTIPRYDPPTYPPPTGSPSSASSATALPPTKAPDYDGYGAGSSHPYGDEKAPGYETAIASSKKDEALHSDDDEEDLQAHGPRMSANNPYKNAM